MRVLFRSTFSARDGAASFATKASWTPACTYKRLVQTQVWPLLRYLEASAPSTAASTSASSKTMKGAFPPSSIDAFLIVGAHWTSSSRPTSVDPVKLSLLTKIGRASCRERVCQYV